MEIALVKIMYTLQELIDDSPALPLHLAANYEQWRHCAGWRKKSEQRKGIDNYICQVFGCGETDRRKLHCHHRSYQYLRREPMEHLLTVCETCHGRIHGKVGKVYKNERRNYGASMIPPGAHVVISEVRNPSGESSDQPRRARKCRGP